MTKLQQLIMTLLTHRGSMTGYDISKFLKDRTKHHHQQIYKQCAKLEAEGFLTHSDIKSEDKPDAKVYSISSTDYEIDAHDFSDFSKTEGSVWCVMDDARLDVDLHKQYIEHMQNAEINFFKGML